MIYPNDTSPAGKQLRLEQEYFFVSCALQDCIRLLLQRGTIREFADKFAIQLNDTHPSLAIPELMRLLIDVHDLGWNEAWDLVRRSIAYTNHTLLPEALETWPLPLIARLLPRHLEIIYEINRRFLDEVRAKFPGDDARLRRMSLIGEDGDKLVRMAHLATVASHHVNGVAALHSRLLRQTVLRDFAELWPERFTSVTNGVTPRRFIGLANPRLAELDHRRDRRRLAARPGATARAGAVRRRRRVPGPLARGQAGQQGRARDLAARALRPAVRPGGDARRAVQADPRVQAPAPQHPARDRAVRADPQRRGPRRSRGRSSRPARPRPPTAPPS